MDLPLELPFDPALALFLARKLAALLILPPLGPLLLVALGLLSRRLQLFAWTGLAYGLFACLPWSVGWLLDRIETAAPLERVQAADAQAIVVLGAGQRRNAPEYGGATVNRLSLERLRYGARLARQTGLPLLVSGGAVTGEPPEAVLMKDALEQDFGLPVRWVEDTSRDTRANAQRSATLLRAAGVSRVLLVTHAAHMPRAQAEFEHAGLTVIPAPTAWLRGPAEAADNDALLSGMPSAHSAYAGWFALHELLGGLVYRAGRE